MVRNPSSQAQSIHLRLVASSEGGYRSVTTEVELSGGEQRELELPILLPIGKATVTAEATTASGVFGRDKYEGLLRQTNLIVMMCASDSVCKTAQSQIQFSGTIEERVDKNRQIVFEMVNDPRTIGGLGEPSYCAGKAHGRGYACQTRPDVYGVE
jgi:hypothetical protein